MKKYMALLSAIFLLTACSSDKQYTSLPDDISLSEDENIGADAANIDDVNYFALSDSETYDGRFLITSSKRTDTTDGKVYTRCTRVGCEHNVPECGNNFPMVNPKFCYDRIYYIDTGGSDSAPSKVCCETNGEQTVIFENKYVSAEDENRKTGAKIYHIILTKDGIFCFGNNDVFKIDYDGNMTAQPIEFGSGGTLSGTVIDNDRAAVTDMNFQLFVTDFTSGSAIKISDHARAVSYCDGKLYYINSKSYIQKLMCCDLDGKNAETLIDDCYIYTFTDKFVYYIQRDNDYVLYRYDKQSGKTDEILTAETAAENAEDEWASDECMSDIKYYPYYKLLCVSTFSGSAQTTRSCLLDEDGNIVKILPAESLN